MDIKWIYKFHLYNISIQKAFPSLEIEKTRTRRIFPSPPFVRLRATHPLPPLLPI